MDDELHALYSTFKRGVRILVLSDGCHSGTVVRAMPPWESSQPAVRTMPLGVGNSTYKKNKATYDKIQKGSKASEKAVLQATVLLISGCQDNQFSLDGDRNGLFTGTLKKVWSSGNFAYGYRRFRDTILSKMPPSQSPNYFVIGAANSAFESQRPFKI